jgi:hypothetical protein
MEVLLLQEVVAMMSAEDEAEMRDAVRWFRDMEVVLLDGEDEDMLPKVIKLDKLQRYMLLKLIWRSSLYDLGEKKRMLERER